MAHGKKARSGQTTRSEKFRPFTKSEDEIGHSGRNTNEAAKALNEQCETDPLNKLLLRICTAFGVWKGWGGGWDHNAEIDVNNASVSWTRALPAPYNAHGPHLHMLHHSEKKTAKLAAPPKFMVKKLTETLFRHEDVLDIEARAARGGG